MAFLDSAISTISSNPIIFGTFLYLFVLSFFLKDKFEKSALFYVFIIVVPLLFAILYTYFQEFISTVTNILESSSSLFTLKNGLSLMGLVLAIYLFNKLSLSSYSILALQYSGIIVGVLIAMVFLSIVYKINQSYIYNMKGISGFIINFILYIPCLISDFVEYLYGEFATTPKIVYILFVIELILILLYLYLPRILKNMERESGKVIVDKPMRINAKKDVSNYMDLQKTEPELTETINIRKKYALSMWVYVVPMPSNHIPYNGEANILSFASHPKIVYDGLKKKFVIYYNETEKDEFDAPLEKWNHILVNYDKDSIDMFLNGELKTTVKRKNETFSVGDIMTIGQESGLQGGIAKVVYYDTPLLAYEIGSIYRTNKDMVGIE
jgi:hypothetical protein